MKAKKNEVKLETMEDVLNEMYDEMDDGMPNKFNIRQYDHVPTLHDVPGLGENLSEEPGLTDQENYTSSEEYDDYIRGVMFAVYNKLRMTLSTDDYEEIRLVFQALPSFISKTWNLSGAQDYLSEKKAKGAALNKKDFIRGLNTYISRFGR